MDAKRIRGLSWAGRSGFGRIYCAGLAGGTTGPSLSMRTGPDRHWHGLLRSNETAIPTFATPDTLRTRLSQAKSRGDSDGFRDIGLLTGLVAKLRYIRGLEDSRRADSERH